MSKEKIAFAVVNLVIMSWLTVMVWIETGFWVAIAIAFAYARVLVINLVMYNAIKRGDY